MANQYTKDEYIHSIADKSVVTEWQQTSERERETAHPALCNTTHFSLPQDFFQSFNPQVQESEFFKVHIPIAQCFSFLVQTASYKFLV